MTEKGWYPLELAEATGQLLVRQLAPFCRRIELAGSIRRRRPDVGDIEVLAIPEDGQTDPFGQPLSGESLLDQRCRALVDDGNLDYRLTKLGRRTFGPQNKLMVHRTSNIPVDIFSATEENWGMAMVVRTGPADFNRAIMSRFLDLGMAGHAYGGVTGRDGDTLGCPTEERVFELLSWEWQEPQLHGVEPVRELPAAASNDGSEETSDAASKLAGFPKVGWSNKRAWSLLQRAKPFVLTAKDDTHFVQAGGFATPIDEEGRPTGRPVSAAKLLDPEKRPRGLRRPR